MKVIIAGSRTITEAAVLDEALHRAGFAITEVVCGGARGVDTLGAEWATRCHIPVRLFLADWKKYGRRAGTLRNQQMASYADALIAVWDGQSRGTAHMIAEARKHNLQVSVHEVPPDLLRSP